MDTLSQMRVSIAEGNGDNLDCTDLVSDLKALGGSAGQVQLTVSAAATGTEFPFETRVSPDLFEALAEASKQVPLYHAKFRLSKECLMKFVRAFMAISAIQESGELLACEPNQEDLEEEAFETDFELVFQATTEQAEIHKKLSEIGEVDHLWLGTWVEPTSSPTDQVPTVSPQVPMEPAAKDATAAASAASKNAPVKRADTGQTVRVDVARLDSLMNLVGELVIDRTRIAQIGTELEEKYHDQNIQALGECVSHIARISSDLQDLIMKVRMLPIETVFNRFPRVVRDLALKLGKEVELELVGGDTELDRSVIEIIGDPLLHLLRNSVDHGIEEPTGRKEAGKPEKGRVTVSARHKESHIVIEISDDGKGIDAARLREKAVQRGLLTQEAADKLTDKDAIQLIFHSGLSTATEVSEVSGRGVGMDIVRSNIQKVGGLIDLESTLGEGSKIQLRLPLTLAIIRGLLVQITGRPFVIPLGSVVETLKISSTDIQTISSKEVVVIRGATTPLLRASQVFDLGLSSGEESTEELYVVIVGAAEQRLGLIVDGLIGEQEAVIKSLSRFCGDVAGINGATILGDGNVALIIDVNDLVTRKGSNSRTEHGS